jgi:hypothetical protein
VVSPRTQKISAGALVLIALAAPGGTRSQPVFDLASGDVEREMVDRVERIEARGGPRSADLIGPLRALSLVYEESGDHALAAAAIDRAWDLVRINFGVQSLDQVPLIQRRIEIERARGNLAEVWNLEQTLLVLARRHPDDVRTIAILREIADERMDILERYVDGEFPPQVVFGCYYDAGRREPILAADAGTVLGECLSGSRSVVVRSILWEAQMDYSDAIKVGLRNDLYSSDVLRELEMDLVRSSFLYGAMYEDGRDYALGRESLRRLAAYEAAGAAPPLTRIEALIQIADWDILYSRSRNLQKSALGIYERAVRRLRQSGQTGASIEEIFAPDMPVVLPAFLPNPLVSEATEDSIGFIDVAFDVTKEGKGRKIEILETTTSSTRAAEKRIAQLIKDSRFRPRLVDGQFADSSRVVVRYYLNDETAGREVP